MSGAGDASDAKVLVAVRVRPKLESAVNALQAAERYQPEAVSKLSDETVCISETKGKDVKSATFSFDRVFDRDSTQEELYEETTLQAVDAALQGHNSTIMTYGQTGSGKTFTVLGSVKANPLATDVVTPDTGLFLRAVRDILRYAEARQSELHLVVGISVLEVYLENVRDLLSKDPSKTMRLVIDNENVALPDLVVQPIHSLRDAIQVYKVATAKRVARATDANDQSSRSHALFCIELFQQPKASSTKSNSGAAGSPTTPDDAHNASGVFPEGGDGTTPTIDDMVAARDRHLARVAAGKSPNYGKSDASGVGVRFPLTQGQPLVLYSKMVLTDLAGSEKLKHSNAKGDGFEEMKKINGSLTSLGNVVHALFTNQKHVPYRDSKLTIILRSSFSSPNAHVVLIANVAPTQMTYDETLSTLFFANKVKAMKAQSTGMTDIKSESEYLTTLRQSEELCAELRVAGELAGYRPSISSGLVTREDPSKRRFRLQTVVKKTVDSATSQPVVVTADVTKQPKWQSTLSAIQDRSRTHLDSKRSIKEEDLTKTRDTVYNDLIGEYRKRRQYAESSTAKVSDTGKELQADLRQRQSDFESQRNELDKAVANLAAERSHCTKQVTSLQKSISDSKTLVATNTRDYEAAVKRFMDEHSVAETQWKTFETKEARLDQRWERDSEKVEQLRSFLTVLKDYCGEKVEIVHAAHEVVDLRQEATRLEVAEMVREMLIEAGRTAVGQVQRKRMLAAQEKLALERSQSFANSNRDASPPPASAAASASLPRTTSALKAPPRPPPKARPGGSHVDPNQPASPSGATEPSSPVSAPPPPKRPAIPKRPVHPPSIFDNPSLMDNIIEYVAGGATLLKHGRQGQPHNRFFYIVQKPYQDGKPLPHICWTDDEPSSGRPFTENAIDLTRVTQIQLGENSPVFNKTFKANPTGLQRPDYYCSFSLFYQRSGESRTLDVVCDTPSEMESWVIALCYFARRNPTFGHVMNGVESMPGWSDIPSAWHDCGVLDLCAKWHLAPKTVVAMSQKMDELAIRRRMRVAMLTAGELCTIAQLDIFRSTALWNFFLNVEKVLKPTFLMGRSYIEFRDGEGEEP